MAYLALGYTGLFAAATSCTFSEAADFPVGRAAPIILMGVIEIGASFFVFAGILASA